MPVAFLTGRSTPVHERLAFERGALDFIDKSRDTEFWRPGCGWSQAALRVRWSIKRIRRKFQECDPTFDRIR
jgi:hypothetical protein